MENPIKSKVFWGIVLTGVIGALTAIQAVSPTWGGVLGAFVALLTVIGHTSNLMGIKQ